jgi:predicted nucleic acid-binding protein
VPTSVLADTGFLVALLSRRDAHHDWAAGQAATLLPPWCTCEAVLTEAFHVLGPDGGNALIALLRRTDVHVSFEFRRDQEPVLALMRKYSDVPMSLADACLVRMSETHADPIVLTTDGNFHIYRRHSRQVVPCVMPGRSD